MCINWGRHHPDVKIGLVGISSERIKEDEAQMTAHVQIVKSQVLRPQAPRVARVSQVLEIFTRTACETGSRVMRCSSRNMVVHPQSRDGSSFSAAFLCLPFLSRCTVVRNVARETAKWRTSLQADFVKVSAP